VIGVIFLFIVPWVGIVVGIVGVILLVLSCSASGDGLPRAVPSSVI
jgi:hypothetical protein